MEISQIYTLAVIGVRTSAQSCTIESGRWTDAIQMFHTLWGLINIVTLERFALSGNTVSPCVYQGASHHGKLSQTGFVLLTVLFVWTLLQLWKSLRGLLFCRGLVLKSLVMLSLSGECNNVRDRCPLAGPAPIHALQRYVFINTCFSTCMEVG